MRILIEVSKEQLSEIGMTQEELGDAISASLEDGVYDSEGCSVGIGAFEITMRTTAVDETNTSKSTLPKP